MLPDIPIENEGDSPHLALRRWKMFLKEESSPLHGRIVTLGWCSPTGATHGSTEGPPWGKQRAADNGARSNTVWSVRPPQATEPLTTHANQ
jgi:hypothetical protein